MAYLQPNLNKLEFEKFSAWASWPTPQTASGWPSTGFERIRSASRSSA